MNPRRARSAWERFAGLSQERSSDPCQDISAASGRQHRSPRCRDHRLSGRRRDNGRDALEENAGAQCVSSVLRDSKPMLDDLVIGRADQSRQLPHVGRQERGASGEGGTEPGDLSLKERDGIGIEYRRSLPHLENCLEQTSRLC